VNTDASARSGHLPEVLCNEDNVFFIAGGFSHDAARIALALHLRDCEEMSAEDAYVWANDVKIETRWMKWSDDDSELMVSASEVERDAELLTVMAVPDVSFSDDRSEVEHVV
jgi:hypothetical protein